MKFLLSIVLSCSAVCLAATPQDDKPSQIPPNHPAVMPELPPGHPSIQPSMVPVDPAPNPDDVKTPQAIVAAYYSLISGPAGQPREWDRFRALFLAEARLMTPRAADGRAIPIVLTPDQFIDANRKYFENGGYFENEVHQHIDVFAHIAHVFSTYESRRARADAEPYSTGINSIQLIFDNSRWWIVSVIWDSASSEFPLPAPESQPPGP